MKILAAEIELREQTRETQQAQPQLLETEIVTRTTTLQTTQQSLMERTDKVIEAILDLPEGESKFAREINQLTQASSAMSDAEVLLGGRETGKPTIAAETEAIEWLLQARRAGSGGGGGGSNPGDGNRSGRDLATSALAQLGNSGEKNAAVVQRETEQATGKSGRELPDEFRHGLDRYFEVLETK
jgi:DNA polymerase III delta prime subunit